MNLQPALGLLVTSSVSVWSEVEKLQLFLKGNECMKCAHVELWTR